MDFNHTYKISSQQHLDCCLIEKPSLTYWTYQKTIIPQQDQPQGTVGVRAQLKGVQENGRRECGDS